MTVAVQIATVGMEVGYVLQQMLRRMWLPSQLTMQRVMPRDREWALLQPLVRHPQHVSQTSLQRAVGARCAVAGLPATQLGRLGLWLWCRSSTSQQTVRQTTDLSHDDVRHS
eukprot:4273278-Pyramimonas_sp.AAC.2